MGHHIPPQPSIDMGSEYDSRPNSELKDVESRPHSGAKISRTSSNEALFTFQARSYSIDETVSDNLKITEPFSRPKSPLPQSSISDSPRRISSDCDDKKLR